MSRGTKTIVNRFLQWANDALSPATVNAYQHQLDKFVLRIRNKSVDKLCPADLTAWAKTWHEYQAVIRCFRWAVQEAKLIAASPFDGIRLPARKERSRILLPADQARLLRASTAPGRAFIVAMRATFARPQEIRAATWADLQADDAAMCLPEALAAGRALIVLRDFKDRKKRKESNRPRVLLVNRRLGRLLLRLMNHRPPQEQHIFLNSRGEAWTNQAVRCLFRRLRKRLKIKPDRFGESVVAYTLRHTQATHAAANGVRDRLLADILGHVETRTTARYCHLQVEHLRKAVERLIEEKIRTHKIHNLSA